MKVNFFRAVGMALAVIMLVSVFVYLLFFSEACLLSIWCNMTGAKENMSQFSISYSVSFLFSCSVIERRNCSFLTGLFWRCLDQKKCSSCFLNVMLLHFVHCAQLNIKANIPGFSQADCQLCQPMRNQDVLEIMLSFGISGQNIGS